MFSHALLSFLLFFGLLQIGKMQLILLSNVNKLINFILFYISVARYCQLDPQPKPQHPPTPHPTPKKKPKPPPKKKKDKNLHTNIS